MNRDSDVPDTPLCGPEIRCQPGQLGLDLVPFDRNRGSVDGNDRTIGHRRTARLVRGGELDVPRGDEALGDDDRLGVGGNRARRDRRGSSSWPAPPTGSIAAMVPTFTPATRTSSPG